MLSTQTTIQRNSQAEYSSYDQVEAIRAMAFPKISFQDFKQLPYSVQKNLIARNRIINTDTYNRTMGELSRMLSDDRPDTPTAQKDQATFVLQLRRSPFEYLVASGIEDMVEELTVLPIQQEELDFARQFYKSSNVRFFNEKMWQDIIDNHEGRLPFEIKGVKDGTLLLPSEPLLTVKGPEELMAHFEHVFHRVFYSTLVATRAHAISNIIGDPLRFVEVGKRGAVNEDQHLVALKAAFVGGGIALTSNDAGAVILPVKETGTIGHRYVQRFSTEEGAFRYAVENLDRVTLLVDLVETYQGIDLALKLKEEYRKTGKQIWLRLDSGDVLDQTRYFLRKTAEKGMTDSVLDKVIVEGIEGIDEIRQIDEMVKNEFGADALKRVVYGAGGLLISKDTSRAEASSGFKLSEYSDHLGFIRPSMKFSNSPGKISYPGAPKLVIEQGQRIVAQEGERLSGQQIELFETLYCHGKIFCGGIDSASEARARVIAQSKLLGISELSKEQLKDLRAKPSIETATKISGIERKYGLETFSVN